MKQVQLQIGITLDQKTLATVIELLTQVIQKGTARQAEAVAKLAEAWTRRNEHQSPPTAPVETTVPNLVVEQAPPNEKSGLIDANEVAKLLSVSPRMVWRLRDSGKMPMPVKIGSLVRWPREKIEAWIEAGCPREKKWKLPRR